MAIAFDKSLIKSKLGWSNAFDADGAFPLDLRAWFGTYEEAVAAAATAVDFGSTASKYHFGQQLYVFDGVSATTYLIQGDGSLQEIGKNSAPMLFVADEAEMLALTDIESGQQVYREDTHTIWLYKGTSPASIDNWTESAVQNDTKWQGTENRVNFYALTSESYAALTSKDASTLYCLTDVGKIYKGTVDLTQTIAAVDSVPDVADAVSGVLYLDTVSLELKITWNNSSWYILSPGYLTDGANWATASSGKLATIGLIKEGIQSAIDSIEYKTSFDSDTGEISVNDGDGAILTGVAHSPTYDSTQLKLTIPVYGQDDIVVNIPKDKFVTAGQYNADTHNIELTIDGQEERVLIPAADLVDVYTANNEGKNITITVSDNNEISASLSLDPSSNNALTYTSDRGFLVDVSNKVDKLADAAGNRIVMSLEDGSIAESDATIQTNGDLSNSVTEIPVSGVVKAAINAAVDNKLDKLDGSESDADVILVASPDGTAPALGTAKISDLATTDDLVYKIDKVSEATENNVVLYSADGGIKDANITVGSATLTSASATTLATEAAVMAALSWGKLTE